MSFLGTLEQVNITLLLQRIEEHKRIAALIIKQDARRIEFYFRDGRLMCIGPVRSDTTPGDRLVKAGIISPEKLRETLVMPGAATASETRLALILMELGYITHDDLYLWASKEAASVFQVVLAWQSGDVYLEEGIQPPADRLLIALPIVSLLPYSRTSQPVAAHTTRTVQPLAQIPITEPLVHSPSSPVTVAELITETQRTAIGGNLSHISQESASDGALSTSIIPPQALATPVVYPTVDTTFLRPEMALFPAEIETVRRHQSQMPISPEQWLVLTRVNGQTTLGNMCYEMAMPVNVMRRIVGELLAMELVKVSMPQRHDHVAPQLQAYSPAPPNTPPYPSTPLLSSPPATATPPAFEAESQWGNGENGAAFVPGQGWIANRQPSQPLRVSGGLFVSSPVFAGASAGR